MQNMFVCPLSHSTITKENQTTAFVSSSQSHEKELETGLCGTSLVVSSASKSHKQRVETPAQRILPSMLRINSSERAADCV